MSADILRHLLCSPSAQAHHIEHSVFLAIQESMVLLNAMFASRFGQRHRVEQTRLDGIRKERAESGLSKRRTEFGCQTV